MKSSTLVNGDIRSNVNRYLGRNSEQKGDMLDIFEQYNKSIDTVVRKIYTKLQTKYDDMIGFDKTVSTAKSEINNKSAEISEISNNIAAASRNKDEMYKKIVEEERQKYINLATVYSEQDIARQYQEIEALKAKIDETPNVPSKDDIRSNILSTMDGAGGCVDAARSVIDMFCRNFGEYPGLTPQGKWTPEFSAMYNNAKQRVEGNNEKMIEVASKGYTRDSILKTFGTSIRKNPYILLQFFMYIFFLPIAMAKYKYKVSVVESIKSIINDFKYKVDTGKYIFGIVVWFIEWIILITGTIYIKAIAIFIGAALIGSFVFSKKKAMQAFNEVVAIAVCYGGQLSSYDNEVDAEYNRLVSLAREEAVKKYNDAVDMYNSMIAENKRSVEEASKNFDPSTVDADRVNAEYARKVAAMKERIKVLQNEIANLTEQMNSVEEKRKELRKKYDTVLDEVDSMLTDSDVGVSVNNVSEHFLFIVAQADMFALFHTSGFTNPVFGRPIKLNGELGGNLQSSEVIPTNMVITHYAMSDKEISDVIGYTPAPRVVSDINAKLNKINSSVSAALCKSGNDELATKFDMTKFYKLKLAPYACQGSLILYDSSKDKNYIRTISNMCLNGIIRSTFVTTNVGFVKFNIVAKDTTMFKDADPILYRGTNNEYQNTLRKKKLYTIYDSEKCSELYSGMRKSMDDFRRSVRQADCKDMIEYNAKRVHMGSAPQPIEYLILWDDIDKINSSDLTTILKESGGSQAGGHDEQFMNVTGVIPILVLDIAPLRSEKPDMSVISGLRDIVDSVGYSNFFSVGTSADTLNYMHRDAIIRVLDDAEKKSKKA